MTPAQGWVFPFDVAVGKNRDSGGEGSIGRLLGQSLQAAKLGTKTRHLGSGNLGQSLQAAKLGTKTRHLGSGNL